MRRYTSVLFKKEKNFQQKFYLFQPEHNVGTAANDQSNNKQSALADLNDLNYHQNKNSVYCPHVVVPLI